MLKIFCLCWWVTFELGGKGTEHVRNSMFSNKWSVWGCWVERPVSRLYDNIPMTECMKEAVLDLVMGLK